MALRYKTFYNENVFSVKIRLVNTNMGVASWLTKAGIRVALVAGAVKVSLDNKVWTLSSTEGETLYNKLTRNILNGTVVYKEKLPSCEEVQVEYGSRWNNNVNTAFNYLNDAPEKLKIGVIGLYKKIA